MTIVGPCSCDITCRIGGAVVPFRLSLLAALLLLWCDTAMANPAQVGAYDRAGQTANNALNVRTAATKQPPTLAPVRLQRPATPETGTKNTTVAAGASIVHEVSIEDPGGAALSTFYAKLHALERGSSKKLRIAFFGASHVASDCFTDEVRRRLQIRFGDAGPGFLLPAKPRRHHRHGRAVYESTQGFHGVHVRVDKPGIGRYGLAGVALVAQPTRRAWSRIKTQSPEGWPGRTTSIELHYLLQPGGGRLQVRIDDRNRTTFRTAGERRKAAFRQFSVEEGEHALELRTFADGPVRIFGAVLEGDGPGVVVDTLGVPGSRARYQLQWRWDLFAAQLARRAPALFVLAYGTNEAGDDEVPLPDYAERLRTVVRRMQATLPEASCLLIGPSDRPILSNGGHAAFDRPRTAALVDVQRKVSAELGCGFFDLFTLMGGPLSMMRWVDAKPQLGAADHVHFTRLGYKHIGRVLYEALMADYSQRPRRP